MLRIDSSNIIQGASDGCLEKLQGTQESIEGTAITDFVADGHNEPLLAAISQARDEETALETTYECPIVTDGGLAPAQFEFAATTSSSETLLASIELAEQTHGQQETMDEDYPIDYLINIIDDPAIAFTISDSDAEIKSVNTPFVRVFGHTSEQAVTSDVQEFILSEEFNDEDAFHSSQQSRHRVEMHQTIDGVQEFLHYEIRYKTNQTQYGIAIYTDVFTDYQPKEQLQVLHRVFRHNLRNELTVILGMAEEVQQRAEASAVQTATEKIIERAEYLENVSEKALAAEDILDNRTRKTTVEAGEIIQEAITTAKQQWPSVAVTGEIEYPLPIETSPRINEAIYTLIENSITHNTEDPKVEVRATQRTPIHSSTRATGDWVSITVRDNGPGVPEHIRDVVFHDDDITNLKHGEGLGLWLVRWIVDAADGELVYRRSGGWTEIELQLPLSENTADLPANNIANHTVGCNKLN